MPARRYASRLRQDYDGQARMGQDEPEIIPPGPPSPAPDADGVTAPVVDVDVQRMSTGGPVGAPARISLGVNVPAWAVLAGLILLGVLLRGKKT